MIRRLIPFLTATLLCGQAFAFTTGNVVTYSDNTGAHVQDSGIAASGIVVTGSTPSFAGEFLTDGSSSPPSVSQMLAITNAGPGASSYTGVKDYLRLSIGAYPTASEFAGDAVANIGSVQGIVGAVVQPSNVSATVSGWFGVVGYSGCHTDVGLAGSCTGVAGYGVAFGASSGSPGAQVTGLSAVGTNSSTVTNVPTKSGFDKMNISSVEVDVNLMKLPSGAAPKANSIGIAIVGASETQPSSGSTDCNGVPCLATAVYIEPMGLSPTVGWLDGIRIVDASTTSHGISIGAVCPANAQCSTQPLVFDAYSAAGAANIIHGTVNLTGAGFFSLNAPASGQVALQVNAVTILSATSSNITATQPIVGGSLAGSQLTLTSTSSGSPSGDQDALNASTTFINSQNGSTTFASFASGLIDLTQPVRFPASTTGAVTPTFTNAPTGCSTVVWIGPLKTTSPAQSGVYLAACHT